jgi:hypothetical protein
MTICYQNKTNAMTNQIDKLIYSMLTESTGINMMDSGGGENRGWQRNQKRTLSDFQSEPEVSMEVTGEGKEAEYDYTISVFHYLKRLELDEVCNAYNRLKCKDWDSEIYGVSEAQAKWLERRGLKAGDSWNTYNGESNLSQILQGTNINREGNESNFEYPDYVLIQIHNGCDARGGYTDAKLFKLPEDIYLIEDVSGTITSANGTTLEIDNRYDGSRLTDEDGNEYQPESGDKAELYLM